MKFIVRDAPSSSELSPSVWRVWIEIKCMDLPPARVPVTLRVEGVD